MIVLKQSKKSKAFEWLIQYRYLFHISGWIYILFSLTCTLYYIIVFTENAANDHWWRRFNSTGGQTYLMDLYNSKHILKISGEFDFFDTAISKDYSTRNTMANIRLTSARRILLDPIPLKQAIETLRRNTLSNNFLTMTQYCWVDVERKYGLAHTIRRQERCENHFYSNGAVILEILLRNAPGTDISNFQYSQALEISIYEPLRELYDGEKWVENILNHKIISLEDEIKYLNNYGIYFWQIQLTNQKEFSQQIFISILNAMGSSQQMTVSLISGNDITWTTAYSNYGFTNDIMLCGQYNCSLIQNTTSSISNENWDYFMSGLLETESSLIYRNEIGPYQSIDIYHVTIPNSLIELFLFFQNQIRNKLNIYIQKLYFKSNEPDIDPIPILWYNSNYLYYGGNPMCPFRQPMHFIQPSFSVYDTCASAEPFLLSLRRESLLFSWILSNLTLNDSKLLCNTCQHEIIPCLSTTSYIYTLATSISIDRNFSSVIKDSIDLNIGILQAASKDGSLELLFQPLISLESWDLFGWLMIYEWIDGQREVYTFAGDSANYTTISPRVDYASIKAIEMELPHNASTYVWWVVVYISITLFCVGIFQSIFGLWYKSKIPGENLLHWNRVVGSVWIGRPFMAVRGAMAIVILSTAPISFLKTNELSHFKYERRDLLERFLIISDSLWFNYAIIDFFIPWTKKTTIIYAPLSGFLSFFGLFLIETISPVQVYASINQECIISSFYFGLKCNGGFIQIGSIDRMKLFFLIHFISLIISYLISCFFYHVSNSNLNNHILIPSASSIFLVHSNETAWHFDIISCIMSGIFPFRHFSFDIKTWSILHVDVLHESGKIIHVGKKITSPNKNDLKNDFKIKKELNKIQKFIQNNFKLFGWLSLGYMIMSVSGSYGFLILTESAMTNDFWWVSFDNITHAFLSNIYNKQLQLSGEYRTLELNALKYSILSQPNNVTDKNIRVSPSYPILIQDEINTLKNVIEGLRSMDGCMIPWISTSYCYVDFNHRWEMASSYTKQLRCKNELENGAIYIETILRNIKWKELNNCWGNGLNYGIFSYLKKSIEGENWLKKTEKNSFTIPEELLYWSENNINSYITLWQNYKNIGIIETFIIKNAFGLEYPLTLKNSKNYFQIYAQTSYIMNWGFASDLNMIQNNNSILSGLSLIRQSELFAFLNYTMEDIMMENGTLISPIGPGLSLVHEYLGPFGTILLKRIAIPLILKELYLNLTEELNQFLSLNNNIQNDFWLIYNDYMLTPKPEAWDIGSTRGGNIMCELDTIDPIPSPRISFQYKGICTFNIYESIGGTTENLIIAYLISDAYQNLLSIETICLRETIDQPTCINLLKETQMFLLKYRGFLSIPSNRNIKNYIKNNLNLSYFQFMNDDDGINEYYISIINFFDLNELNMELFSWIYLFDWVRGTREVVSFQGDKMILNTISAFTDLLYVSANEMEIPLNVATYIRYVLQYVTGLLFGVACMMCAYILSVQGEIEAKNVLSFNRVAGMVWVGRPLVLVRAVTGILMLSTSRLVLTRPLLGLTSWFVSTPQEWTTTILSSGELSWFVYIINDTFSVLTRQYTYKYSFSSSLLVWFTAGTWAIINPVHHIAIIDRKCSWDGIDFQFLCTSGSLEIGSYTRFCGLVYLVFFGCFFSYCFERIRNSNLKEDKTPASLFLYASAKHQFFKSKWEYNNIHFLDKASAVLNGVVTCHWDGIWYILDVKTWRIFIIKTDEIGIDMTKVPSYLVQAMPLID